MDNPRNTEPSSSSSEESSDDFEDCWTESEKKDFMKTWVDGIKSYVNDQTVKLSLEVRHEIKEIKRRRLLNYYMKKLSNPKRIDKNLSNKAPDEKKINHANNYEVAEQSNTVLSDSYVSPVAHKVSTSFLQSDCKTLLDIINYVLKYGRRPGYLWKIDTERLWSRLDTLMIQNSEGKNEFASLCKRALESLDGVNLVKPMVEYIRKDLYAIDHHEPENLTQIYHRYNSLIRQITDFCRTFEVQLRYLFTFIEICGELQADALQHLDEFLSSYLDFYRDPEPIF